MKILAFETSCDETAVAVVEAEGEPDAMTFRVLGNALFSQASLHQEYGGVFPSLAKREHAKNLMPLLQAALTEAQLWEEVPHPLPEEERRHLEKLLRREPDLARALVALVARIAAPSVDALAVTTGPGLEPALWVGVNAGRALAHVWRLPFIPTNHLEGHLISALTKPLDDRSYSLSEVAFPVLGLIISGGHTEMVYMEDWHAYRRIGGTRDDALGEAYDKVARMLDLPYPGGPRISRMANTARKEGLEAPFDLPRPMLHSDDHDFSFSGLKTAVLYTLKEYKKQHPELTQEDKRLFALEFENAVFDVIAMKVSRALKLYDAKTLVVAGGVSANLTLRKMLTLLVEKHYPDVTVAFYEPELATDNAVMIAMAAALRADGALAPEDLDSVRAAGALKLTS